MASFSKCVTKQQLGILPFWKPCTVWSKHQLYLATCIIGNERSQARGQHSLGEISRPARDARKRQRDSSTCARDTAVLYRQEARAIVRGASTGGMAAALAGWGWAVASTDRPLQIRLTAGTCRSDLRSAAAETAPSPEALLPPQRPPAPPLRRHPARPGT
jgi:hypothetical protein